jgi:hypothetical protein
MNNKEIELAEFVFNDLKRDNGSFEYWKKTVLNRIEEIKPSINELINKSLIQTIGKDLSSEWNQLIMLRNNYLV